MNKREKILGDIGEDRIDSDMKRIFDQLDTYQIKAPSMEATNQLLENLKPIFREETAGTHQRRRFRDILEDTRSQRGIPVLLQLVGAQTALMSKGFITLTMALVVVGLLLANLFESSSSKFLITMSPFLGLFTLFYEYRARLYKVEEMEGTCRYSPVQVAAARLLVVLGYNVVLCTAATVMITSSFALVIGHLMMNWLAPLLLILGIALFTSLKLGIAGGCMTAGVVWAAQITLMDGASFLHLLLPGLTNGVANAVSMLFGIGLLYVTLRIWQQSERWCT